MRKPTDVEALLRRHAPQVLGALVRRYGHFDAAPLSLPERRYLQTRAARLRG
ncbi:hypothetical protein [Streptomyces sp. S.PNR 29]|uniref:hypothetical protein n=1 Tax=Streptomyces sp. S.PNR 29 TaxID=2973805 RepID=UPI0025B21BAC|nr:hypothetical protein [Streptomyces sp. S.PNR 29]MDN0195687.1 hypothetical protein [Streptomyces sp. S.PNR 29]